MRSHTDEPQQAVTAMETSDKQTVAAARQPPHVPIVLALHREGEYIPRALASLADAARHAAAFGITTEMVAVLDRPDYRCGFLSGSRRFSRRTSPWLIA